MISDEACDVAIIGAGHNGLVCAWYLARSGLKVRVFERRSVVGGAAVTEEFHPGFRNSVASYTVSLLNPKVIKDMDLAGHGLTIVERKVNNLWPHPDGNFLAFPVGDKELKQEIALFSRNDAEALERYFEDIGFVADLIRDQLLVTPVNFKGGLSDLIRAAKLGSKARNMSRHQSQLVVDIFTQSVADFLAGYFEHDAVKAAFAFDGVVGNFASPYTPGSAYVLMHHAFGEVNGKKGVWGHAVGGMGAITQAMKKACEAEGVIIDVDAAVESIITDEQGVQGIKLENQVGIQAKRVAANTNPWLVYNKFLDQEVLPGDVQRRMQRYKNASGTFRMNVALSALPKFSCLRQSRATAEHLTGGIIIGHSMAYLDHAYLDAKKDGWSKKPIVEMLIPTTLDSSLAPEGKHVASLFCQQFSPDVDWEKHRDTAAELILDTVEEFAPGFKKLVVGRQVLSPLDLEQKIGLVRGDIMHGVMSLDQMYSNRPVLGYGDYRTPVKGLYICGSGTHPGGGVTGVPGHNAAQVLLKDLRSWFS
jgi:phytoene dehydrogenase-like protein